MIKNSSAADSRWPRLYVCTHSNATDILRKACSERTLLLVVYGTNMWKHTKFGIPVLNLVLSTWLVENWRIITARHMRTGFRKFSKKNSCIARTRRDPAGLKGPRSDLTMTGRCDSSSSAGWSPNFDFRWSRRARGVVTPEFCSAQLNSKSTGISSSEVTMYDGGDAGRGCLRGQCRVGLQNFVITYFIVFEIPRLFYSI